MVAQTITLKYKSNDYVDIVIGESYKGDNNGYIKLFKCDIFKNKIKGDTMLLF